LTALVDFRDETAGFAGQAILDGITLRIEQGERIAVVGESGAGKSTLLRLIYERCGDAAALVPQELGLVQSLSVFHNVYIGRLHLRSVWHNLRTLGWPARGDVADVRDVLVRLRLEDKIFAPVGTLSGGQQQRTAVGRALYHPGDIFIADEPVSAVDEQQAREILEIASVDKRTAILAMHDRTLAIRFADRLIGLKGGRIVLDEASAGMKPGDLDFLYQATA
jgi:phosphonate transport system ATP-binding protein